MTYSMQTFTALQVLTAAQMNQVEINIRDRPRGIQTVWVPAGAMSARTTNGAAIGAAELSTNKIMRKTFDFDQSTIEYVQFQIKMPKGWDEGTINARFVWTATSGTATNPVVWALQAVACGDDDALDAAFGTAIEVSDAYIAANDVHLSAATSNITVGGTPVENDLVIFQAYRDATDVADTLAADALLLGIEILINFNAQDDS